ncbi:EamA family transporter [Candidatus Pelagibacter bacterium nBUS_30]|uniref:EamA family transporter n=1 Tax=unclassified Candidatus Pelagibacter TaxID=2647897 RepID=UPI003EB8A41C
MNNYILFLITLFCWSPTWYLIKFQLGYVDPLVSVFYRFLIAAIIIFIYIISKKKNEIFCQLSFMVFIFWNMSLFN